MNTHYRGIKSFVLRQGRMTSRQKEALERLWGEYGLTLDQSLKFDSPTYLEIGFGMGDSLWKMAKAHPENQYLGVEVHRPGVGSLLDACEKNEVHNLRVFNEDVNHVLDKVIPDDSLSGICIFFPDPWPKKRHHKRRLVQPAFIEKILPKLKVKGTIHLATDWESYAVQMMDVLSQFNCLENQSGSGCFAKETGRPETKFEQRGRRLGHGVWDLVFVKERAWPLQPL